MDSLERKLLLASRAAAALGVAFLLLVAALSVADILVREIYGRPIRGATDLSRLATIIIIAVCFPAGLLERRQIKVALLGALFGPTVNRILETFAAIMTGAMFLFIAWQVTKYAQSAAVAAQYTMVLNLPIAPWWWVAAICFWACVPAQIFVIVAEMIGRPVQD